MDAGLVTSMSGALAQSQRVEVIANNLANADTPGFKSDDLTFEESLMGAHQEDTRADLPERPYKESELLSRSGDERRPVLYGAEYTRLRAGNYRQTGNSLDVAIEGNGFLEVLTPQGIRLTRAGNLALDAEGRLVTRDGFLILAPGPAVNTSPAATASLTETPLPTPAAADPATIAAGRALAVGSTRIRIDSEGNIYQQDGAQGLLGKLSVVQVENPQALKKSGKNLFEASSNAFVKTVRAPGAEGTVRPNPLGSTLVPARLHQGMLEGSNVNPITEMTNMIEAHRLFDQNTKLMQVHGDLSNRLSEIGKF